MAEADDVQAPGGQTVQGRRESATGPEAPGQAQASVAVGAMIRRPRFPLTMRLAWMESELGHASRLLPMLIEDLKRFRREATDTDAKVVLVATVAMTALLPFGVEPRKLEAFLEALAADGDLEQADVIAAELMQQVVMSMVEPEGEGH